MSVEMKRYSDEAARERQPKPDDEQEKRIVGKLQEELLSTEWSRNALLDQIKPLLINYFKDSFLHTDEPQKVHDQTQEVLRRIAEITRARIVGGEEDIVALRGKSVFLATNHLGTYKVLGLDPEKDLGHPEIGLQVLHPFPVFYASLWPVAERLGDGLYEAAHDYPDPIRTIQMVSGSLIMPPGQTGTLEELEAETKEMFESKKGIALTLFPEGGTSGKRNDGGIYDMNNFRKGSFVIAGHLGIPVVPVAQYFDPNEGFKLRVFPALHLESFPNTPEGEAYYGQQAASVQSEMQEWLNQQKASA